MLKLRKPRKARIKPSNFLPQYLEAQRNSSQSKALAPLHPKQSKGNLGKGRKHWLEQDRKSGAELEKRKTTEIGFPR